MYMPKFSTPSILVLHFIYFQQLTNYILEMQFVFVCRLWDWPIYFIHPPDIVSHWAEYVEFPSPLPASPTDEVNEESRVLNFN
jgi:hypothetical protein